MRTVQLTAKNLDLHRSGIGGVMRAAGNLLPQAGQFASQGRELAAARFDLLLGLQLSLLNQDVRSDGS